MAKLHAEERKTSKQSDEGDKGSEKSTMEEKDDRSFKLDSLVSGVSQMSSKLVSGGLDTLEGIGKKTITILQETNPDIKNKIRGINTKPVLSDILKEAKERQADDSIPKDNEKSSFRQVSFELLFEDYKGTVFYEALEILANQSKMKIDMVMKPLDGKALKEIQETLEEVKELCELPDTEAVDDEFSLDMLDEKIKSAIEDLNVQLNYTELSSCVVNTKEWLENLDKDATGQSIYTKSVESLANICALSVGNLHKLAELLLSLDHRSTADEADSLTQYVDFMLIVIELLLNYFSLDRLATLYCHLLNHVASLYSTKITALESNDENKKLVTNIFLEVTYKLQTKFFFAKVYVFSEFKLYNIHKKCI